MDKMPETHPANLEQLEREIEHRKQIEAELKESQARLQSILRVAPIGIGLVSNRILLWVNDRVCEMTGYSSQELVNKSARVLYPSEEDFQFVGSEKYKQIANQGTGMVQTRWQHKDGKIMDVLLSSTPLDPQNLSAGVTFTVLDITERVRAEKALVRDQELAVRLMESSPVGITLVNREGKISFANQRAEEVLGLARSDITQRAYNDPQWKITTLEGQPFPDEQLPFSQVMTTGKPVVDVHHIIHRPDGQQRIISINAVPLFDEHGQVEGMIATIDDITERIQIEEALRQSESRYRQLVVHAPAGIYEIDLQHQKFLNVNDVMCEYTGYSREEFLQLNPFEILNEESQQRFLQRLQMIASGEAVSESVEYQIRTKQGQDIWVMINTRFTYPDNLTGQTGTAATLPVASVIVNNISDRKRAEMEREALLENNREQARKLRQIMDTLPDSVILLDQEQRIIHANPAAERELLFLCDARVGDVLHHLGDRPLEELLTSPETPGLWHTLKKDLHIYEAIARPVEDCPTPESWVLSWRDVTRQRDIEHRVQLQERLAAVGQLAAGIAHDFNNIMAVIVLYAQMSMLAPGLSSRHYDRLKTIFQQARRATDLIQQILDFSRRAVLERLPMDLLPFLKEQVKLLQRTLPENIQVELNHIEQEFMVSADPTRMQQVVMNLALNARDAMPEGGNFMITLNMLSMRENDTLPLPEMSYGDWVKLQMIDSGEGITPEAIPHIFEPFFTTKSPTGSGLGLAQVHGIIAQHEGFIDVHSEPGKGTEFTIYLPALQTPPDKIEFLSSQSVKQGKGEVVLLVEDDPAMRKALSDTLTQLNYYPLEAADGQEALHIIAQYSEKIQLVLSDLVMPKMGGQALFHTLRVLEPDLPVVLISGHPMEKELRELMEQGLAGYLLNPPDLEELAESMDKVIRMV